VAKYHLLDLGQIKSSFVVFGDLRMKKLLIATAALAMVAGTAQAQSSVTVYGNIDAGYSTLDTDKNGETGKNTGSEFVNFNADSTSRLGFRGTEDLGGGLKASFSLETALSGTNATTPAATTLGGRAQWIELASPTMGTLRAGYMNSDSKDIWGAYDASGASNVVGNINTVSGKVFDRRVTAIKYMTPVMSGFQATASLLQNKASKDGEKDVDTGSGHELGLKYNAGALSLAASYTDLDTNTLATAATVIEGVTFDDDSTSDLLLDDAADATNKNTKQTNVGASYNLGVAKVFAQYAKHEAVDNVTAANTIDADYMSFGVSAPFGKTDLFANYTTGESQKGTAAALDAKGYIVGARYNLSKRTYAYAIVGNTEIDTAAAKSTEQNQVAFGINHKF
jgi:predicted porin